MVEKPQWFKDVMDKVTEKIKDVTTIDVVTAVVDDVEPGVDENSMKTLKDVKFRNISYYARTTMHLDGDRFDVLPTSKNNSNAIRDQVIEVHTKNASSAMKNWNNMAKITFTGIVLAASMSGVEIDDKVMDLINKFGVGSAE